MKTTHTPGPWIVIRHATPEYAPQFGVYSENGHSRNLATVHGSIDDARLIEASPDLLAALQAMLANPNDPSCWAKGRAAIAKATGD